METTKGLGEVLDTQGLASYLETVTANYASESVVLLEMFQIYRMYLDVIYSLDFSELRSR